MWDTEHDYFCRMKIKKTGEKVRGQVKGFKVYLDDGRTLSRVQVKILKHEKPIKVERSKDRKPKARTEPTGGSHATDQPQSQ